MDNASIKVFHFSHSFLDAFRVFFNFILDREVLVLLEEEFLFFFIDLELLVGFIGLFDIVHDFSFLGLVKYFVHGIVTKIS